MSDHDPATTGDPDRRTVRVALVDDQHLVRAGFRMVLDSQPDLSVLIEASNGQEAVTLVATHPVDVVLMDVRMPRMDGIEATRQIVALPAAPKVIVLTTFDLDEYVMAAIGAGASGFLLKDAPPEEMLAAVRTVFAGDAVIGASSTRRLLRHIGPLLAHDGDRAADPGRGPDGSPAGTSAGTSDGASDRDRRRGGTGAAPGHAPVRGPQAVAPGAVGLPGTFSRPVNTPAPGRTDPGVLDPALALAQAPAPTAARPRPLAELTPREYEVFVLMAAGLSNGEIAAFFVVSEATVKTHVGRVLTKTAMRDRVQVVVLAYQLGIVRP